MRLRNVSKLKYEAFRFALVGGLNAVLTFVVFYSLLRMGKLNYLFALTVAWVVGVLSSYILNYAWVFKPELRLQFKERFRKYFLAYLFSFMLNLYILNLIVENSTFDPFYVQGALIPVVVMINFVTSKFWSLRQINSGCTICS